MVSMEAWQNGGNECKVISGSEQSMD